jgi:uncharacterized protein DUF3883
MSTLAELKPTEKLHVMDLVKAAGVDVSDWVNVKGGRKRAAMNPKYCYEWSFEQPGKVVVLNIWHDQMETRNGTIVLDSDMRRHAQKYAQVRGKEVWSRRAGKVDEAVRSAFVQGLPVRVVVVDGKRRSWRDRNPKASRVDRRMLDPLPWAVTAYDVRTGQGTLTRRASPLRGRGRNAHFSEIRSDLQQLASEVTAALSADARATGLKVVAPGRRRLEDDNTGGYWTTLGSLTRDVSMEMWLDHFSGVPGPRAWVGFTSGSWSHLSPLLSVSPLARMSKDLLRRTTRDVTAGPFFHFKNALHSTEFDVLVHEGYSRRHYLGVFYPYCWPFSRRDRQGLVREATNLLAGVYGAVMVRSRYHPRSPGAAGPWARPNPRSEHAAIRHVSRHLRDDGYSVRSREREICGYDLHATRGGQELHVEVKGCRDSLPRFFISRTELKIARADTRWRLAVVTNASRRPAAPRFLTCARMQRVFDLEATQWEGRANRTRG